MARPTISQRIALEGGEQIKRALTDLGQTGEDAFAKLQKAGERVNLTAPVAALAASTKTASATIEELRQRMAGVGGVASQSGSGFAAFGSIVQTHAAAPGGGRQRRRARGLAVQEIGSAFAGSFGKVREFGSGVGTVMGDVSTTVLKSVAALGERAGGIPCDRDLGRERRSQSQRGLDCGRHLAAGVPEAHHRGRADGRQRGEARPRASVINEKVQEQSQNFFANQKRLQDLREATIKGGLAGRQAAEDYKSLKREMELFGPSVSRAGNPSSMSTRR